MATVLVTGGSSGIGLATVRRLAAAGDRVFAASRAPSRNPLPDQVTAIALDVADPAAAKAAVQSVVEVAGSIDVLVNNAGVCPLGSLEETTDDDAHRVMVAESLAAHEVPERSPYRAMLEAQVAQDTGRIETAGDPDQVAAAIEGCIRADDPPERIVVGRDAEHMAKLVHDTEIDELARLLRSSVASLTAS